MAQLTDYSVRGRPFLSCIIKQIVFGQMFSTTHVILHSGVYPVFVPGQDGLGVTCYGLLDANAESRQIDTWPAKWRMITPVHLSHTQHQGDI